MTVIRTATPIAMRGFDGFGFCGGAGGGGGGGGGGGAASSTVGGVAGVGGASVVIGRRREHQRVVGAALLAGADLDLAGEIQLVGATRGQMLANTRAHRAAKSHVHIHTGVMSPAGHPALTCRTTDQRGLQIAMRGSFASRTPDWPRNETRCGSLRCPAIAVTGLPDGSDGSTPARTSANRPSMSG